MCYSDLFQQMLRHYVVITQGQDRLLIHMYIHMCVYNTLLIIQQVLILRNITYYVVIYNLTLITTTQVTCRSFCIPRIHHQVYLYLVLCFLISFRMSTSTCRIPSLVRNSSDCIPSSLT